MWLLLQTLCVSKLHHPNINHHTTTTTTTTTTDTTVAGDRATAGSKRPSTENRQPPLPPPSSSASLSSSSSSVEKQVLLGDNKDIKRVKLSWTPCHWLTLLFAFIFHWDHRRVQDTDWDQISKKSESHFFVWIQRSPSPKFGLSGDRSVIRWDQTWDSAIFESKVNRNWPHYTTLVLPQRDTLILFED